MITKGQRINDRYEIIKSIGEGGMANVYLARDIILDRKVAIKVLRGDLANDEKFIRRFQREALSASSLSHPTIVEMYDVGEDGGNYFIAMEYVEGRTLKQLLKKRGTLTVSEAIDIMLQLTDGIAHAHDSYIIHRDLKAQNIMIMENGAIKITDFGIAMALNSTQLTQTNSVMGSVHYLPPEQASGNGSTIKSDIYSMGILFYELLTGTLPYRGETAVEIALKHMKEPFPSIRKQNPNIPQSVENIILKSVAKNPKNRYNDVKEMHHDLETALKPEMVDQPKCIYKYQEHEVDESRLTPTKTNVEEKKVSTETEKIVKPILQEEGKKTNILIWILSIIFLMGVIGVGFVMVILPIFSKTPTEKIPDVSGLSVVDAERVLSEYGFIVATETQKITSDNYAEGLVVKTDPIAGRTRKKGTTIVLYESIGDATYTLENYVGRNYIEIKTKLEEVYKLKVTVEKKEVELTPELDEQEIVEQSLEPGTKVVEGDSIILYIPDVYLEYPDFAAEGWTVEQVQEFCDKYEINLSVSYEASNEYPEGTIIKQSRTGKIVAGVALKIYVTKLPETVVDPGEPPVDESLDSSEGNEN